MRWPRDRVNSERRARGILLVRSRDRRAGPAGDRDRHTRGPRAGPAADQDGSAAGPPRARPAKRQARSTAPIPATTWLCMASSQNVGARHRRSMSPCGCDGLWICWTVTHEPDVLRRMTSPVPDLAPAAPTADPWNRSVRRQLSDTQRARRTRELDPAELLLRLGSVLAGPIHPPSGQTTTR
jgi:hypothetical protein